ncbi:MAG: lysophospholipid acyltransferase family protein [Candidatus Omnitrophota bacterium]
MILYALYRIGYLIANSFSLKAAYAIANCIADIHFIISKKDRSAIIRNLEVVAPGTTVKEYSEIARSVFRNFAKYLVDFFRYKQINNEYFDRLVEVKGAENIDQALARGKGVIALSAHIGNWELGGVTMSHIGHQVSAVVMVHLNKKIDEFFTRQRMIGNLTPIPIGPSLKKCFYVLKKNNLLALLGDRDFSTSGMRVDFFGKEALIPTGPAVFSQATGAAIVPCFMIRKPDDTFWFFIEKPIYPESTDRDDDTVRRIILKYLSTIEKYVKKYPSQWYMFREVWNNGKTDLRNNTIV